MTPATLHAVLRAAEQQEEPRWRWRPKSQARGAGARGAGAGAATYAAHDRPGRRDGNGDEVGFLLVEGDSYAFVTASGVREV